MSRSQSPDVEVDHSYGSDSPGASPSHCLLVAIMRRAIWDFVLYKDEDPERHKPEKARTAAQRAVRVELQRRSRERQRIAEDAAGWLFWDGEEPTDPDGLYTFRYICELLELEPAMVRRKALAMSRHDIQTLNNHIREE